MRILTTLGRATPVPRGLAFALDEGWTLRVTAPAEHLLRIVVAPARGLPLDRTWMVAPEGDTPREGRNRDDLAGFPAPGTLEATATAEGALVATARLRARVMGDPVRLVVEQRQPDGTFAPVLHDRPSGAYVLADHGRKLRHYQTRDPDGDRFFGLGDKTGPLDRHGRRFRLLQVDALGYDAEASDPLYKHVPFLIARPASGGAVGLFHDTLAPMTFDLGAERSNYHGFYRYAEMEDGALDLWIIAGPKIADVVTGFARLTGLPNLPPRWTLGFAHTSMHLADAADGQAKIAAFADRARAERIPISALHFGSGYSSRGKRRYVFTWNRDKFPDPPALFAKLRGMGLKTVANLKPVLIDDHPAYAEIAAAGGFITAADGTPVLEQFWDGMGSFLDFTNETAVGIWRQGLAEKVLDVGFDAGWNDNNETEAWREDATLSGHGRPFPADLGRPLIAHLMTRATYEEQAARAPGKRVYTITRAGPPGVQRYAETWTGDNHTSWHTLKWNLRNGLSLSLSNMGRVGHDIGGFAGPRPDPELLIRWVEMMALHPRALMNSWKPPVGEATAPWTHAGATDAVRSALLTRYRFLPVLYTLLHEMHATGMPIIRPLFLDHEEDGGAFEEQDAFMLGRDLLVAPVVAPGARTVAVRPPRDAGGRAFVDVATGRRHAAGRNARVPAPLGRLPILAREGAVMMLAGGEIPLERPHDAPARHVLAVAGRGAGRGGGRHVEDDGETLAYRDGDVLVLDFDLTWTRETVTIAWRRAAGTRPMPRADEVTIEVLGLDGRELVVRGPD
jgi:alpha-glucosidase